MGKTKDEYIELNKTRAGNIKDMERSEKQQLECEL